jgi:asparagine synthase (glutamine-hydrolysing)
MITKTNAAKMSVKINLEGLYGKCTRIDDTFYCVGEVFYQQSLLTVAALHKLVAKAYQENAVASLLREFSGFYAFVYFDGNDMVAAVDRNRSRPLFHAQQDNSLYLSDSAHWVVGELKNVNVNLLAEQEFQQAGYVSGSDTLLEQLSQVPAASVLLLTNNAYQTNNYYRFMPSNNPQTPVQDDLYNNLNNAMKVSINELIAYANGRQLVVPLSGGYDSRAIALYLKELNYDNVVTFTFGKSSSEEVSISKQVAEALGFDWHCIEYNNKMWRVMASQTDFNHYLDFISSFVSVPNVQVLPAIKSLLADGVISADAILVPGHTGDFVSGGHIPKQLLAKPAKGNAQAIVNAIISRHYRSKSPLKLDQELTAKLLTQVNDLLIEVPENLPAVSVFEAWEYNERQAKFIVNSNRYYDFYKLDWWMPLWHNAVTDFWVSAPLNARLTSSLWQDFLKNKYQEITGDTLAHGNVDAKYSARVLRLRTIFDYFTDANCLYALVPFHRWLLRKLKYPYANGTLFSFLSATMIKRQKKLSKKAS